MSSVHVVSYSVAFVLHEHDRVFCRVISSHEKYEKNQTFRALKYPSLKVVESGLKVLESGLKVRAAGPKFNISKRLTIVLGCHDLGIVRTTVLGSHDYIPK